MNDALGSALDWALGSPLLWLPATLLAFHAGTMLNKRAGGFPLVNPVLIAMLILIGALLATGTDYATYFEGAKAIHLLLGPATVALAVPLYANFHHILRSALPMGAGIAVGSFIAAGSAAAIAHFLGADDALALTLAVKSITAPIAMGTAEQIGGIPALAAIFAVLTGVTGTVLFPGVLKAMRIKDWRAIGLAAGVTAHGQGTARALAMNETAGAFSGLAMGLNALFTAIWLPILVSFLLG